MDRPLLYELQPPDPPSYQSPASPSPEKQAVSPYELDPLLNLSPSSTLQLLRGAEGDIRDGFSDGLRQAIKDVSSSERAFGMRAAVVAGKIGEWYSELQDWQWPGTFEQPLGEGGAEGLLEGSLPADVVARLEHRVEAIKDEFEELDLEELKSFVRNSHLMPNSRASSLYEVDFMALSQFHRLDDFTALITATIMQALPSLQQLTRLLDVWSVRLLVLHQIPGFLGDLDGTRAAIDSAWNAIGYGTATEKPVLSRGAYETMRSVVQTCVSELGAKLDAMLDALEGHEDRLPDHWIDSMEAAQADCENWIVVADREVDESEWREQGAATMAALSNLTIDENTTRMMGGQRATTDDFGAASHMASRPHRSKALEPGLSTPIKLAELPTSKPVPITVPAAQPSFGTSSPKSTTSSSFSDISEPQILDASPMQIIKSPIEEKSSFPDKGTLLPNTMSRHSSEHNETSAHTLMNKAVDVEHSPLARYARATSITPSLSSLSEEGDKPEDVEQTREKLPVSRASVASIEFVPRKDVRNITITRNSSTSSAAHPRLSKDDNGTPRLQTLSTLRNEDSTSEHASELVRESSPSPSTAALHVSKHRKPFPDWQRLDGSDHEDKEEIFDGELEMPTMVPSRKPLKTIEDQLAARISSILTHIPANIRFKSGLEAEALDVRGKESSRTVSAQASVRASRATTPALTLAPAAEKASKPRASQEQSGIKLYHLHQPDREQPIKLYVRLVGEGGERVMVRVGGGWADLGEYLKEYALHHGRRSASDGKFGVISVPGDTDKPRAPAPASGRVTPDQAESPPVSRKTRFSSGISAATPQTPEAAPGLMDGTPGSAASVRSGTDDDAPLGLAGPKNKDVELSPKKRAWVNGMLSQARQASAEKKRSSLAELGKVGSTRRFFRGKQDE